MTTFYSAPISQPRTNPLNAAMRIPNSSDVSNGRVWLTVSEAPVSIPISSNLFEIGQLGFPELNTSPTMNRTANVYNLSNLHYHRSILQNLQNSANRDKFVAVLKGVLQIAIIAGCILACVATAAFIPVILPHVAIVASIGALIAYTVLGLHYATQTPNARLGPEGYERNLLLALFVIISPIVPFINVRNAIQDKANEVNHLKQTLETGFARLLSYVKANKEAPFTLIQGCEYIADSTPELVAAEQQNARGNYDQLHAWAEKSLPPLPVNGQYTVVLDRVETTEIA